jgi:6-phosphogluconate dehydrogenase
MNQIAVIGLAVMGQNFILNMADKGFAVAVYNRTAATTQGFLAGQALGKSIQGFYDLKSLVESLERPRRVLILVKAGDAVDQTIAQILPYLEAGDIVIDSGNSHFPDTERRYKELAAQGIRFVGSGISGGEEGARNGPSLMPGGDPEAWPHLKAIFEAAAAKVEANGKTEACTGWVGKGGAGHYVKMIHNGIEYGDMQLICEAYHMMKEVLGYSAAQCSEVFSLWNTGVLDSYLVEITADILRTTEADGSALVDQILDKAGQKGTGKWTVVESLDHGVPVTLIAEAVFARALSSQKDARIRANTVLPGQPVMELGLLGLSESEFVDALEQALYCAKLASYTQGFQLMAAASKEFGWELDFGAIAMMWRGGCIIRSGFLGNIREAFVKNPALEALWLDPYFAAEVARCEQGWRKIVALASLRGIPVPAHGTALSFFDGSRRAWLPANLLQAQRDYFGAHTFQKVGEYNEQGEKAPWHHHDWTGSGGFAKSGSYNA